MGNSKSRQDEKEDKIVEEAAKKEVLLECPVLVDLDHGTIHHRHKEALDGLSHDARLGYFYHPRLNDFSEDALNGRTDDKRLKYAFKKGDDQKLFFIVSAKEKEAGKNTSVHNTLSDGSYKPQGKGFSWPESYRQANHNYYNLQFELPPKPDPEKFFENEMEDTDKEEEEEEEEIEMDNQNIRMSGVLHSETVGNVIEKISLDLLKPSAHIHIIYQERELGAKEELQAVIGGKCPKYLKFTLTLG